MSEYTEICGEVKEDLNHHAGIDRLNLELAVMKDGMPVIIFEEWKKNDTARVLFKLHLKEAIKLKSIIDNLILDATLHHNEYVKELMDKE